MNLLKKLNHSKEQMDSIILKITEKNEDIAFSKNKIKEFNRNIGYLEDNRIIIDTENETFPEDTYKVFDLIYYFCNNNINITLNYIYLVYKGIPFLRVGVDYFKVLKRDDRWGVSREYLKIWKKPEIIQDWGKQIIIDMRKLDDFTLVPNNLKHKNIIGRFYNQYSQFEHTKSIKDGSWEWTERMLKHIFGNQYELGIRYIQLLYLFPEKALPILVLVSEERQTGKSTFIDWLDIMFGANMVIINPSDIGSSFNSSYATKNIIAVEESRFENIQATEKLKALSTQKKILVNTKFVQPYSLPFFGKLIITSNDEVKFSKVDREEIRYWIRKIPSLKDKKNYNAEILSSMRDEIPYFLRYLQSLKTPDMTKSRMVFTQAEIETDALLRTKEESQSTLYKDIVQYLEDIFNNDQSLNSIEFIPSDIKERWFSHNSNISPSYIRTVLKKEFHLDPGENRRYAILDGNDLDKRVGRAYSVKRSDFNVANTETIEKNSIDVPF